MDHEMPTLVVVAYNRPLALRRSLASLSALHTNQWPRLVISVDAGGDRRAEVLACARTFAWPGHMEVLVHPEPLGLKEHVLRCGDLTATHGPVVVLEDDVIVSPALLGYAQQALSTYAQEPRLAGISLYALPYNETAGLPFRPVKDGYDAYFIQQVSSSGQLWTKEQWSGFRAWFSAHAEPIATEETPRNVRQWPGSSWKKHFIRYLVATDRYFLFPQASYTSNCGDEGTHYAHATNVWKSDMALAAPRLRLPTFGGDGAHYDAFLELLPRLLPATLRADITVDLNGTKDLTTVRTGRILTTRACTNAERTFGMHAEPLEMNVLLQVAGEGIHLCKVSDVTEVAQPQIKLLRYHSKFPQWAHAQLAPPVRKQVGKRLGYLTGYGPLDRALAGSFRAVVKLVEWVRR
jgi:hypothetical protein